MLNPAQPTIWNVARFETFLILGGIEAVMEIQVLLFIHS